MRYFVFWLKKTFAAAYFQIRTSICRWVWRLGGPVGILRSVFFLENVCSLIFVVSLVVSGLFLDAKKKTPKIFGRNLEESGETFPCR